MKTFTFTEEELNSIDRSGSPLDNPVIKAMALAFFADAFASAAEEAGWSFPAGVEIMQYLPDEIHPEAVEKAVSLWETLEANETLELFGHYAAMQFMGHGVGLEDFVHDRAKIPYGEGICLDGEYTDEQFEACGLVHFEDRYL